MFFSALHGYSVTVAAVAFSQFGLMSYCLRSNQFYRHLFILLNFNFFLHFLPCIVCHVPLCNWRHITPFNINFCHFFSAIKLMIFMLCTICSLFDIWNETILPELKLRWTHRSMWRMTNLFEPHLRCCFYFCPCRFCALARGNELTLNVTIVSLFFFSANPLHFLVRKVKTMVCRDFTLNNFCEAIIIFD